MKHTEERPMDAKVTGTVAVIYGAPLSSRGIANLAVYLAGRYNCYITDMEEINEDNVDIAGMYLNPQLYAEDNINKVEQTLWVLSDVLGNVQLEDWHSEVTPPIYMEHIGKFRIHTGNQHHMNVALRVLVIELV